MPSNKRPFAALHTSGCGTKRCCPNSAPPGGRGTRRALPSSPPVSNYWNGLSVARMYSPISRATSLIVFFRFASFVCAERSANSCSTARYGGSSPRNRSSAAGAVTAHLRSDPAYPDISSLPDRHTRSPQMLSCVVPLSRKRSPACFAQLR